MALANRGAAGPGLEDGVAPSWQRKCMPAGHGAAGVRPCPGCAHEIAHGRARARAPLGRGSGHTAHRAGGTRSRTFFADAVCWMWLASLMTAKPPAEGPATKFLILCIAFTWLPLTGARARRVGVLASASMTDACCLATGRAACCCGCCLLDEPMRKTLFSIAGAFEKRPGPDGAGGGGSARAGAGRGLRRQVESLCLGCKPAARRGCLHSLLSVPLCLCSCLWLAAGCLHAFSTVISGDSGIGKACSLHELDGQRGAEMRECRVSVSPANFARAAGDSRARHACCARECRAARARVRGTRP
jgi:hypothetical protein